MTITEIRNILENPYDRKVWKSFLQTQFTNNKLNAEDRIINLSDKTLSKQCLSLGNYEINEYVKIGIFEIELNDKVNLSRNRVALRNLLKDITNQVADAMVVFTQGNKWRFSYISKRKIKNSTTNTIEDKETAPKRYTYLFGKDEKALTAAQRFDKLIRKQKDNLFHNLNLNDFEEAFSVEKLSREFFKSYKDIYEDFVEYITGYRYVKKASKWSVTKTHEPHFDFHDIFNNDDKAVRDFFKRMLGRIVFLYFIQKKGWLAVPKGKDWDEGNHEYIYQLYKNAKYKELFYSDYLVPLFFETLNDPKSESENKDFRFPYLNGGLFDRSQDQRYDKLILPSSIFDKLFETFNNFNFTIYEDAPDEHTVAVDPEMLGHIFENLLEDNKDKGAFYTPKEIVHYMCKESLKAFLIAQDDLNAKQNTVAQSALDKITYQLELSTDETKYAEKYAFKIIDKLKEVKICDPAIGSGAFPMGLLQEIFNAQIFLMELSGFTKKISDAEIKKHIIEESIYGVDIDPGAVDIARLRFWLSLVVDEPKPQPLPNLSFKIVCANTLIPLGNTNTYNINRATDIVEEIAKVREDYFNATKEEKRHLEQSFRNLQAKLWTSAKEWATREENDYYKKISEFNPFEDKSCSWFDSWWMFGINKGFDIVIGNPPYVDIKGLDREFVKALFKLYPTAVNRINLYSIFIEKSKSLLNEKGTLSFIVPNSLLVNDSYARIRSLIIDDLQQVIKLPDSIFENAIVETIIFILNKGFKKDEVKSLYFKNSDKTNLSDLNFNIQSKTQWKQDLLTKFNVFQADLESQILSLIEHNKGKLLDEVDFSLGITPYDKAKGHTQEQIKSRIFHSNKKETKEYVPLISGKNIKRYNINLEFDEYLKYGPWLGAPRDTKFFKSPKIIVRQILDSSTLSIISTYTEEEVFFTQIGFSIISKRESLLNLKYIAALLNSKTISFYHKYKYLDVEKNVFPKILIANCKKLPIIVIPDNLQRAYIGLVDYLLFLNQNSLNILSHTTNERIAAHFDDVLNMMVYELFFEKHMKETDIDILQFIIAKIETIRNKHIEDQIKDFYEWYQKPDNPVRQRMLLIDTRSPQILAIINKSV